MLSRLLLVVALSMQSQRAACVSFSAHAGHVVSDNTTLAGSTELAPSLVKSHIVITSPPIDGALPGLVRTVAFDVVVYDRHGKKIAPDGLARPSIHVSESPNVGEIKSRVFALRDGGSTFGAWFLVPHRPNITRAMVERTAPKKRRITISLTAQHPLYGPIGEANVTVVVRESLGDSLIVQQEEEVHAQRSRSPRTVPGDVTYDIGSASPEPCYFLAGRSFPLRSSTSVYCMQPHNVAIGDQRKVYERTHAFNLRQVRAAEHAHAAVIDACTHDLSSVSCMA